MRLQFWKLLQAFVAIVGHLCLAFTTLIAGWWAIERFLLYLGDGKEILIYNRFPLSYLFQTGDVALITVFVYYGAVDAIKIMRGDGE